MCGRSPASARTAKGKEGEGEGREGEGRGGEGGASARTPHVRVDAKMRLCERDFYRADTVFATSAGKCGRGRTSGRRPRTSGRTFSSKNVCYDILARK
jgi:hypothetical protein